MEITFPPDELDVQVTSMEQSVGKLSVPLKLKLRAFEFSNLPDARANPSNELLSITLPMPEGVGSSTDLNYTQDTAKEAGTIAKLFTETGNLGANLLDLPGRVLYDKFQSATGVDIGRRVMDVTEMDFISAFKRKYSFSWVLTATSVQESKTILNIGNLATAYSLPSADTSSTRMIAPPLWTIDVVAGGISDGDGGFTASGSSQLNRDFLSSPKTCVCTNVTVDRDSSAVYTTSEGRYPISISLTMNFVEIDPILKARTTDQFVSRSELRSRGKRLVSGQDVSAAVSFVNSINVVRNLIP